MRSIRAPASSKASVMRVEVEAAIDRRAVSRQQFLRLREVIAPTLELLGIEHPFQGRVQPGGPEDQPRARPRRAADLPPDVAKGRRIHPVDAVEQPGTGAA